MSNSLQTATELDLTQLAVTIQTAKGAVLSMPAVAA